MFLSALVAVDGIRAWVPCGLLSMSMLPFASTALVNGAISWVTPKKVFLRLDNALYEGYMRLCLFVFENLSGVQLKLYGDIERMRGEPEKVLVLSNHQTNVDWSVVMMLAARQGENGSDKGFRVMVKNAIHYVPLFGWYIFQHGYIYVRRFGGFVGEPVIRQLKWLDSIEEPYWLLVFPEGTRFSMTKPSHIAASKEHCKKMGRAELNNVLCPRAGGVGLALDNLKGLDAVYDVTIGYGQTRLEKRRGLAPGMFEFCCGPSMGRTLSVRVKRYAVADIPKSKEGLRDWIFKLYEEKDKVLEEFYETDEFPDAVSTTSAEPSIAIRKTLPPTLCFSGALLAAFVSRPVRQVYLATIASFPLLILWLHVRKCV